MEGFDIFAWASQAENHSEIVPAFVEWLLASPTPERVQQIRERLGDEGIGIVARGVTEKLMGSTTTADRDLKNFPQRFRELPEDFSKALFGAHYQRLCDIALTCEVLFPLTSSHTTAKPMVNADERLFDYLARHAELVKPESLSLGNMPVTALRLNRPMPF